MLASFDRRVTADRGRVLSTTLRLLLPTAQSKSFGTLRTPRTTGSDCVGSRTPTPVTVVVLTVVCWRRRANYAFSCDHSAIYCIYSAFYIRVNHLY